MRPGSWQARVVGVGVMLLVVAALAAVLLPRRGDRGVAAPISAPSTAVPDQVKLVGFGDSVMSGAGCDCDDFLAQAAGQVESDVRRKVSVVNNSVNGETTEDVLRKVRLDGDGQSAIAEADVIVLTIGANDLGPALTAWNSDGCDATCYQPRISQMADRLSTILAIIGESKKPGAEVLVTDYWNVFEDGAIGAADHGDTYLDWSDQVTRAANAAICRAAARARASCLDLYQPFKGEGEDDPTPLLAGDGDHPNERGTQLIAATVADTIVRRLPR